MSQLTLNLLQGAVSFKFSPESARELKQHIAELMQNLKAIASTKTPGSSRPQPKAPMEYRHAGEVFLEIFCNPNIYPSPFAAKVLITVRDERIRLTSEAELTRTIEDIERYLEEVA
ncbi:hypothetical protein [Oscillatoria sp. FACHB-1406]|uniref:hypothetical protein n=1 Tax=Oscillatoria sp. FACHB-1406 TaxID=2692846 RepID=UPI001683AC84|nr:hypothetical protein [Oscillatoria sp. FACHB-1406]MBD2578511.1 hypothetical protein [Oscillatoria sp. FACHB-1406]